MLSLCDLLEIPPSQSASCTVWLGVDKNEHDVSLGCFCLTRGRLLLLLVWLESGFS